MPYPPRLTSMNHLMEGLSLEGAHTLGGAIVTLKDGILRFGREPNAVRQVVCKTDEIWDGRWSLDGPHAPDLQIRALGEGILQCPDWRETGQGRMSLMASPAVWRDNTLVCAPLAGFSQGWTARIVADFHSSLVAH